MKVSKVEFGNDTVMDITDSTVTENNLLSGEIAYGSDGERVVGTVTVPTDLDDLSDVTITSPTDGQALVYDNGDWVNGDVATTDENVKQTDIADTSRRNLAIASDNTTTEQTTGIKKTMGLSIYTNPVATTSAMGTAVLEVGSNKALNTGSRYKGLVDIYNDGHRSRISSMTTANRNMYITDRTGAFATTIDAMSAAAIVTGGSNLVRYPYYHENATSNNITRVVNTDGSVVFTTTSAGASANTNFYFISGHMQNFVLPAGRYIYKGCPSGGSSTTYYLQAGKIDAGGTVIWLTADYGSGSEFTLTEDTMIHLMFSIRKDYVISGSLTVKPELYYVFQADWSQSDTDARDYIKNKPTLPSPASSVTDVATSSAVGTSTNYARQDHKHKIALATGDNNGQVKIAGTNVDVKGLKSAAYTESTAYAVANKQLTNEDLDTVTDTGFYYAAGGNTCSNKPTGVNNFGLEVIRDASGSYYTQIIYKVDSTTTITSYRRYCKSGTWSSWVEDKFTDTTYTFANGTNGFTVTPSGGTAQTVKVTPSITNNVTGSGTSGYLTKFNGANTITNGPQLGSDTTKFLRNDGYWEVPTGTYSLPLAASGTRGGIKIGYSENGTNYAVKLSSEKAYVTVPWTDTTYTFAEGSANGKFTVTPSGGSAQSVTVHGLGSAAYTASTAYATSDHVHGNITNAGTITSDTTKASGDKLVLIDADNNKVVRSNIALGTSTSTYLRNDGAWATPTNNYDRNRYTGTITAGAAITAKNIIVARASDGKYVHLKTNKVAFDVRYPILYANADIASGSTGNNNYDVFAIAIATTQNLTLTAYKPVYIKGTLSGYTFTTLGTAPLTQTIPSSADGYVYILLGIAYSTTNIYLSLDHRMFAFNTLNGFREIVPSALDWEGPVSITTSSSSRTNISSYSDYHELYFVAKLDSSNKIYATMIIPIIDIKSLQNTDRIFRSGWYQASTNGGEFDIVTNAIASTGATQTWDIRVYGTARMNTSAVSSPDIKMYYR
jgi:hypothetical protein